MSVRVMSAIWEIPMPPTDKLVLLALADCANDEGYCWPSIATIARKSGVCERSVQRAIRKAETGKLLKRDEVKGKGCKYLLTPRHSVTPDTVSPATDSPTTPDTVSPKPSGTVIPKKDKPSLVTPTRKANRFPPPEGVEESVWRDFLASPKRRKAGMSETAYSGILNTLEDLAEHGYPPGKMIALAVERGWTTVKLEWVQNDERDGKQTNSMGRNLRHGSSASGMGRTIDAAQRFVARGGHLGP